MSWVALYVSGGFFVEPSMKQLVLLLLVSVSTAVALSAFRGGGCGGVERGAGGVRWVVCGALLGPEGSRGSSRVVCSGASFVVAASLWVVAGLVGVLFENWTVDASILLISA